MIASNELRVSNKKNGDECLKMFIKHFCLILVEQRIEFTVNVLVTGIMVNSSFMGLI